MKRRVRKFIRTPSQAKILNQWEFFKKYINDRKIGEHIRRKDMIEIIFDGPPPPTNSYTRTLDVYRMGLATLGILKTVGRGIYEIKAHINDDVTSSELIKSAYGKTYRTWFNNIKKID